MTKKELEHVLGLIGNIKKAYQQEQKRLKLQGVELRLKPIWQAIHDSIWSAKKMKLTIPPLE